MNFTLLSDAISDVQTAMRGAITTASYGGRTYPTGLEAKTGLIRSETLIQLIHEVVKLSLRDEIAKRNLAHTIHPPIGQRSPEQTVWGFLKKKRQDLVLTVGDAKPSPELIDEGPLAGDTDELGRYATECSIVIGVRSQLSSVAKNFDTLMERTFAETLNLRFRHPRLVMGEVYLLAVKDYDEQVMKQNRVEWKNSYNNVERYISIFNSMTGRTNFEDPMDFYKYERCMLLLVDFSLSSPRIYRTLEELRQDGIVSQDFDQDYFGLSPDGFAQDVVSAYQQRHAV